LSVKHGNRVRLRVALSNSAKLTLTVIRGKRVVAEMVGAQHKAGHFVLVWSGKLKREFARRGGYTLVVSAITASGASVSAKEALRIT
jgi:hypothetical protein